MIFDIYHQERYSRSELLLRSFFGFFYIAIPHGFILFFLAIWSSILQLISFWVILFTGRYPESFFEFQVKYLRWGWRVNARLLNLSDGYPAFGLDVEDENIRFEIPYKPSSDRVSVILRAFLGIFYVILPHFFIINILGIVTAFIMFIAWWAVLFTGSYPRDMFKFVLDVQRWVMRVNAFMMYLTDVYPPFSLDPDMTPYEEEVAKYAVGDNIESGEGDDQDDDNTTSYDKGDLV